MAKRKTDTHTMIFPVALVVCGKVHEYVYHAEFEAYSEVDNEEGLIDFIKVNKLTYKDHKQRVFDAIDIIDNGEMDDADETIYDSIFGNRIRWDDPEKWW